MTFKSFVGVVLLLIIVSVPVFAQPGPPGDPPTPGGDPVPITGIEWLLLGGGALGSYKFFKNRFNKGQ